MPVAAQLCMWQFRMVEKPPSMFTIPLPLIEEMSHLSRMAVGGTDGGEAVIGLSCSSNGGWTCTAAFPFQMSVPEALWTRSRLRSFMTPCRTLKMGSLCFRVLRMITALLGTFLWGLASLKLCGNDGEVMSNSFPGLLLVPRAGMEARVVTSRPASCMTTSPPASVAPTSTPAPAAYRQLSKLRSDPTLLPSLEGADKLALDALAPRTTLSSSSNSSPQAAVDPWE
mmetsp:Transcript_21367/g.43127  ORF Transcript_21367/g.43127 Transcript_21367/m.43127 type:complete len:226 (-) Transcript_21367:895-1572(-)